MQTNTIDIMASDQLSGSWNAIPYGYSDYSVPTGDWMLSSPANLESARHNCESTGQQNGFFQPASGRDRIQRVSPQTSSPNEASEADPTENSYPYTVSYHYQHHHLHQHHQPASYGSNLLQNNSPKQPQPVSRKGSPNSARLVPHGYYTQGGARTLAPAAPGSPMQQPTLYPSPPGQVLSSTEEPNYNSKPFGMVYMNGNHVPGPIGYTGYADPSLTSLCNVPGGNELYQPYNVPGMGYGESSPPFPGMGLATMESSFPSLKYDAWNLESTVIQPLMSPMEQPIAIKQEYIPSAYHSPSPSTMAGGSCIKMELLSDTSRSPPPAPQDHLAEGSMTLHVPHPSPASVLLPLPQETVADNKPNPTGVVKKSTRKTNDYGDQYACAECRRTFARQCGLTQHTKWHHSGEKPYRCLTCGKCFSEQIALDDHLERHTSTDKPYQCQLCPKAFFHKNDLRRHGFQHTGKAPHACRYCSKTFARKDHCQSHEGSHERKMQRKVRKAKGASRVPVVDGGQQQPLGC